MNVEQHDTDQHDVGQHDVVVIGTGFGGAVSACRLAQAGLDVVVLERGRRYGRGEFPRGHESSFWPHGGPLDVRPLNEVVLVQAAGYGGGSLLYSNVHLRLPAGGFTRGWPSGWDRTRLDPYYDLVAHMLAITAVDKTQPLGVPARAQRLEEAALALERHDQFFRPPLAVMFTTPGEAVTNGHGVEQSGCRHCSECNIGCNVGAKNSLDLNYLAVAERAGADMRTSCEVTALARTEHGYVVHYRDHTNGSVQPVVAGTVVLAAGAINTTELLLRHDHALNVASDHIGERYSANGDFLSFGLDTDRPFVPTAGPAISAALVYSEGPEPGDPWFLVEDGGYPPEFVALVTAALRTVGRVEDAVARFVEVTGGGARVLRRAAEQAASDAAASDDVGEVGGAVRVRFLAAAPGPADHDAILLAMGRDSSDGRLRLLPWPRRHPWVHWDVGGNERLYVTEQSLCDDVVEDGLGGRPVHGPGLRNLRLPISVHNLGGAVMADDPDHGVVDPHGEVFGCPGLFVLDGAAIPAATGVNPSHTIAAVAERNVERLIRRLTADPAWTAPERAVAPVHHDPLPRMPSGGTRPVERPPLVDLAAAGRGELVGTDGVRTHALTFCLRLVGADARRPDAPDPPLTARGELTIGGLGQPSDVHLGRGVVVRGDGDWRWVLPFVTGPDAYVLDGWSRRGELRLALHRGRSTRNRVIAAGVVDLDVS